MSGVITTTNEQLVEGDYGHRGYPFKLGKSDIGGPFKKLYYNSVVTPFNVGKIQGGSVYRQHQYEGLVLTSNNLSIDPRDYDPSGYGATAWRRMKPDQPNMNLLNALYELKDVPGMLRQRFHAQNLHEIGSYYLAQKFGWDPLLRDIRDTIITQINAQKRLEQLLRDEGKPVRRKMILADESALVFEGSGTGIEVYPSFVTYFYADNGGWQGTIVDKRKVWASAQFKYYLPSGPRDINWKRRMIASIFGLRPTPAAVYNAIPWTWLIDWYINLGDVLSNLDTTLVDRVGANYFYLMANDERVIDADRHATYYRYPDQSLITAKSKLVLRRGSKVRLRGDPFGLATAENSLNGMQLSILGALGLSRVR